ncbi:MAG: protein translocase subunit SecD [Candidatus Omnitrophica bacterium]|nr:protein translocase subunit SecD [Candidatus Omnitrophota bacterium]
MSKNLKFRVLIVLWVILAAVFFGFPLEDKINLGLDLKGGMHLVLKVDTEKIEDDNAKKDVVVRAIEILRNRIDGLGVGEPVIQRQGEDQILVQLPGITDRDSAIQMIGQVAQLEFILVNDNPHDLKTALEGNVPEGHVLKYTKEDNKPVLLEDKPLLLGEAIADAQVDFDSAGFGAPQVSLKFSQQGAKDFAKITREHVNKRLAIVLDGKIQSSPNINEPILNGSGVISGQFTAEEAALLALSLRSGALPAPMHIEEERTIGPLLGRDSITSGINAIIIGGILVFCFMLLYYIRAGIISNIALALNLLMLVGAMGLLNVLLPGSQITLTLPGIAGIILTLGMAVDANVLINERIREEIDNGRPLHAAISNGFNKAFKAIFDSNSTTLIAAFMLFQFGSGPIKGFAVTLTIGLLTSLFTSLFVTRTLFLVLYELNIIKALPMLKLFSGTKIDFVSKRYFCFALSIFVVAVSMVGFFQKKEKAYGIDFAGGQIQEYRFDTPIEAEELRKHLKSAGVEDIVIQQFDKTPENIILRTSDDTYDSVIKVFNEKIPGNHFEILRIEKVGPVVGEALRKRAIMAIVFALGGILVFVGFRFNHFDFAAAGVIALLHDVILTLGFLVMMGRQVDLLVVTALLTIAGYSINDTIIVYDRVRENMAKRKKEPLKDIINNSINQTLGRTILTTVTTLIVVVSLFLRGGEVLNTFALCLIIGFISGTYSTIFIASPLVLAWEKKKEK